MRVVVRALLLVSSLGLTSTGAFATGTGKSASRPAPEQARPVARLVSVSRQESPQRERARIVARTAQPGMSSYAAARPAAVAVAASGDEQRAFELINAERRRRGLSPLAFDGTLTHMARYHSQNMAVGGFLNHIDRDGLDLTGRAELLGVRGWRAMGENVAYNQGYPDPTAFAVERWMISDKHRANILNGDFTHAGLGIARSADGRVFFTQVFMKR
jgi:uncharacterized protein YkwD